MLAKVTPHLNEAVGADNWEVDINNPSKFPTIVGETDETKVREGRTKGRL